MIAYGWKPLVKQLTGRQRGYIMAGGSIGETFRRLASEYRQDAERCQEISNFLSSQNANMRWQSPAATRFRDHMDQYRAVLAQFKDDFTDLSSQLDHRADAIRAQE